jgi:hypothetical protein
MTKVEALQFNVYKQFQKDIEFISGKIGRGGPDVEKYDLIIDCFDNFEARSYLQELWQENLLDTALLHIGFSDQFTFAIEWAQKYKVPTDITTGFDICEMPGARSFVATVAALGSLVAQKWIEDSSHMEIVGGKYTHTLIK